jgi:hypothetical protein
MLKSLLMLTLIATFAQVYAGTFADGTWNAAQCGATPENPVIDDSGVDAYNASLKTIKAWQQKAQEYNNCVVNEANADNEVIAKAANVQQERFRAAIAEISSVANTVKTKLDRKK